MKDLNELFIESLVISVVVAMSVAVGHLVLKFADLLF
jgi:hypothetical protein